MSFTDSLRRRIRSYPSFFPRDINLVRALDHLLVTQPQAKIVGGMLTASSSRHQGEPRTAGRSRETTKLVNENRYSPDLVKTKNESPMDIAIKPKELLKRANEWNPDVEVWSLKQISLVDRPPVSHLNFDEIDCIVRMMDRHKTFGRSAGFYGVMNPYYESRGILTGINRWGKKYMPLYRPRGALKTHKIAAWTNEGKQVGYETLFDGALITDPDEASIAGLFYRYLTRRDILGDTGYPEPLLLRTQAMKLLEQTGALIFNLHKSSQRMAIGLGEIEPYTMGIRERAKQ